MEYKPNSHKSKTERQKLEKVVDGEVKKRKRSEVSKFRDAIIAEDAANVKMHLLVDVLIPAVKKVISDVVRDGIDMLLYGEGGGKRDRFGTADKISFRDYSSRTRRDDGYRTRSYGRYSYDDIIIETRGEAEEVLSRMDELIDAYGFVTVADLYDLVGVTGNYTDNKYGWTSIRNAEPVRARGGGYILKLPRAIPID